MDENDGWLVVPMLLVAVVVVTMVGGFLLEYLPRERDTQLFPSWGFAFMGGVALATIVATAVIMAVSITWLGCC